MHIFRVNVVRNSVGYPCIAWAGIFKWNVELNYFVSLDGAFIREVPYVVLYILQARVLDSLVVPPGRRACENFEH